jgi:hypothetical protein
VVALREGLFVTPRIIGDSERGGREMVVGLLVLDSGMLIEYPPLFLVFICLIAM